MTPQEEYKYNESIISSFVKRQEELKIVIRREEKIEMMTDEKLDNLQDKLNKMLELQKQYNTLISDKQSPITKKYLPLPYDINEIIRNKIKEDGKNKKVEDYIKLVANIYKKNLVDKFLNDIQKIFKRRLKFNSSNALGEYDDSMREITNKYEDLCNLGYCINNEILLGQEISNRTFIYNDKNRKLVMELYTNIRCEILVPIKMIVNKLLIARSNDDNDKINTINDIKVLGKNNRFNPNGFKKLCKEILNIFKTYNNILEHIPQDEINDWWGVDNFYSSLNLYQFEIHRLESVRKTMDFLGIEY